VVVVEEWGILQTILWNSKSATLMYDLGQEVLQDVLLARTNSHQRPIISLIAGLADDNKLIDIEFDHGVEEWTWRMRLVWGCLALGVAAEAISIWYKSEVDRVDFDELVLVVIQADIDHRRERNADSTADVMHELHDLIEVSQVFAEATRFDDLLWSA